MNGEDKRKADEVMVHSITQGENPLGQGAVFTNNVNYQQAVIDNIPYLTWLKDREGRFLAANVAFCEMTGIDDVKEILGKSDLELWPGPLAESYMEDDRRIFATGQSLVIVEQIEKIDGTAYWVETYKAPVWIDGEIVATVGYARDIAEQKELKEEVTKKELEYDTLVKNLPLSIIRYDKSGRVLFINATPYDFVKSSQTQQYLGKTTKDFWNPHITNLSAGDFRNRLNQVLQIGRVDSFEIHCRIGEESRVNMVNLLPEFDAENSIVGALALANDVTEISKYRDNVEYMAYHDALTSLPNRNMLNKHLRMAADHNYSFSLMFLDLDLFKEINDTQGHFIGDQVLVVIAKRLRESTHSPDLVARIGGDEFAILITSTSATADLTDIAETLSKTICEPIKINGSIYFVTASIGIVHYPQHSKNIDDLIKYADTAMYSAKSKGRNNFQFYTPHLTEKVAEHVAISTALRYAISNDELSMMLQPKVDIDSGRIYGAEALLRWESATLGAILPDKFIEIAEHSGLIIEIGNWVLRKACELAVKLNNESEIPINIAVNLSSKEFISSNIVLNLQRCLEETGCKAEWITIEITESLLLHDDGKEQETLAEINDMGVSLSIDDFGTGYSALAYLNKYPIKEVKIDRSFVRDICYSQTSKSLVTAIIAMGLSLQKKLIAEGIETKEQESLINQLGCSKGQGYLYSKPVTYRKFSDLIKAA